MFLNYGEGPEYIREALLGSKPRSMEKPRLSCCERFGSKDCGINRVRQPAHRCGDTIVVIVLDSVLVHGQHAMCVRKCPAKLTNPSSRNLAFDKPGPLLRHDIGNTQLAATSYDRISVGILSVYHIRLAPLFDNFANRPPHVDPEKRRGGVRNRRMAIA